MRTNLTPAAVSTMTVTERLALDNLDTEEPSAVCERAFEIGRASALTLLPGWTPLFFDFGAIAKLIQPNWDEDLRVVCGLNQPGGRRKFVCLATCNAPCRHDQTEDLPRVDPSVGNWWVREPEPLPLDTDIPAWLEAADTLPWNQPPLLPPFDFDSHLYGPDGRAADIEDPSLREAAQAHLHGLALCMLRGMYAQMLDDNEHRMPPTVVDQLRRLVEASPGQDAPDSADQAHRRSALYVVCRSATPAQRQALAAYTAQLASAFEGPNPPSTSDEVAALLCEVGFPKGYDLRTLPSLLKTFWSNYGWNHTYNCFATPLATSGLQTLARSVILHAAQAERAVLDHPSEPAAETVSPADPQRVRPSSDLSHWGNRQLDPGRAAGFTGWVPTPQPSSQTAGDLMPPTAPAPSADLAQVASLEAQLAQLRARLSTSGQPQSGLPQPMGPLMSLANASQVTQPPAAPVLPPPGGATSTLQAPVATPGTGSGSLLNLLASCPGLTLSAEQIQHVMATSPTVAVPQQAGQGLQPNGSLSFVQNNPANCTVYNGTGNQANAQPPLRQQAMSNHRHADSLPQQWNPAGNLFSGRDTSTPAATEANFGKCQHMCFPFLYLDRDSVACYSKRHTLLSTRQMDEYHKACGPDPGSHQRHVADQWKESMLFDAVLRDAWTSSKRRGIFKTTASFRETLYSYAALCLDMLENLPVNSTDRIHIECHNTAMLKLQLAQNDLDKLNLPWSQQAPILEHQLFAPIDELRMRCGAEGLSPNTTWYFIKIVQLHDHMSKRDPMWMDERSERLRRDQTDEALAKLTKDAKLLADKPPDSRLRSLEAKLKDLEDKLAAVGSSTPAPSESTRRLCQHCTAKWGRPTHTHCWRSKNGCPNMPSKEGSNSGTKQSKE